MHQNARSVTTGYGDFVRSIQQIANNIDQVNVTITDTSSGMTQLESTVRRVEEGAQTTSDLSQHVLDNADRGVSALQKTLSGIEGIRESFNAASVAIDQLVGRTGSVGDMLGVIDDITEQTELLALNAAIISAQAGEHGRGFAVVADEIRALADRTRSSTKEITELIEHVRHDSQNAIRAMDRGTESVQTGISLGREAESALADIHDSSKHATRMVQEIAQATVDQAAGNRSVSASITRIAETVAAINLASAEQAKSSETIISSTDQMNQINRKALLSSQDQASSSTRVIESIERINAMVESVSQQQRTQTRMAGEVLLAVETIEQVSQQQNESATRLETIIEALQRHAKDLETELARFKTE